MKNELAKKFQLVLSRFTLNRRVDRQSREESPYYCWIVNELRKKTRRGQHSEQQHEVASSVFSARFSR
jgi:hypothetical protein